MLWTLPYPKARAWPVQDPKSNPWRGLQANVDDGGGDGRVSGGSPPGQLAVGREQTRRLVIIRDGHWRGSERPGKKRKQRQQPLLSLRENTPVLRGTSFFLATTLARIYVTEHPGGRSLCWKGGHLACRASEIPVVHSEGGQATALVQGPGGRCCGVIRGCPCLRKGAEEVPPDSKCRSGL